MDDEKLRKVSPNIKYELDMLDWANRKAISSTKAGSEYNSYIVCFLIHVRNLVDFYVKPNKSKSDDVLARHFFKSQSEWEIEEKNLCQFVKSERSSINKRLTHLTYDRMDSKIWDFEKIYNDIQCANNVFMELIGDEQRAWLI